MATAAERVRDRLRPDGTVRTRRRNAFSNSLHDDLTELLADYARMCRLAGELANQVHAGEAAEEPAEVDDDYVCDLDLFRAGWESGFAAKDGAGTMPWADEAFFRLFPDGQPTRSAIRALLTMPLSEAD